LVDEINAAAVIRIRMKQNKGNLLKKKEHRKTPKVDSQLVDADWLACCWNIININVKHQIAL